MSEHPRNFVVERQLPATVAATLPEQIPAPVREDKQRRFRTLLLVGASVLALSGSTAITCVSSVRTARSVGSSVTTQRSNICSMVSACPSEPRRRSNALAS